jgi:hypothetical protein
MKWRSIKYLVCCVWESVMFPPATVTWPLTCWLCSWLMTAQRWRWVAWPLLDWGRMCVDPIHVRPSSFPLPQTGPLFMSQQGAGLGGASWSQHTCVFPKLYLHLILIRNTKEFSIFEYLCSMMFIARVEHVVTKRNWYLIHGKGYVHIIDKLGVAVAVQ